MAGKKGAGYEFFCMYGAYALAGIPLWRGLFWQAFLENIVKFTRNVKILSKPLIPFPPGTTQRSNKSGKNLFAHRKTFFYFPTKESSNISPNKKVTT